MVAWGVPAVVVAIGAFAAGALIASGSPQVESVQRFAVAWQDQDFEAMRAELSPRARAELGAEEFAKAYEQAGNISTLEGLAFGDPGDPVERGGSEVVELPVRAMTRSFGTVAEQMSIPISSEGAIEWVPNLVFPG